MAEDNIFEIVKQKLNIVDVISLYISLTKKGKNYVACCPFHGEKTPSFVVSQEKQIFKCFGCSKSGNLITFIELYTKKSPLESIKELVSKFNLNIDLTRFSNSITTTTKEQEDLYNINQIANDIFQFEILEINQNEQLKLFLKKRRLTKPLIKEFEIGFADKDKNLCNMLIAKNCSSFNLANSSLIANNNFDNFFNDRLMFPIKNKDGRIVAFSGRSIYNNVEPKYLNSSETIVFKKHEVMFNYYHALDEIIKKSSVYLVEGQFDCIALYKINIKNAVALLGTALSIQNLESLRNCNIVLFFDNDFAGKNATKKNLRIILANQKRYNLKVSFVLNEHSKDPDELYNIDEGKTLSEIACCPVDLFMYLFNEFKQVFQLEANESKKVELNAELFEFVIYLQEPLILKLKEKLIENKIFSIETWNKYLFLYGKENFPLHPISKSNLKASLDNEYNKKNYSKNSNYKKYEDLNFAYSDPSFDRLDFFEEPLKQQPKLITGRNLVFYLIIKTIIKHPQYIANYQLVDFTRMAFPNGCQNYKMFLCFLINNIKNNKSIDETNFESYITNNIDLEDNAKQIYLDLFKEIMSLKNKEYTKEELDKNLNNWMKETGQSKDLIINLDRRK